MKVRIVSQVVGRGRSADELVGLLRDPDVTGFRGLVAFTRWSGLALLDADLRTFTKTRPLDLMLGIDLGGTSLEALTYLHELPNTRVRIVRLGRKDAAFHPKVFIADRRHGWTVLIGSSNLTAGGLHTNVEVSVRLDGRVRDPNPCESIWELFDQAKAPLTPEHVKDLTDSLLDELAPRLTRAVKARAPDEPRGKPDVPAIPLAMPLPPVRRAPSPKAPSAKADAGGARATGRELYLELWQETGQGGTQVQVPGKAFTNYFGARPGEILWVELRTLRGAETRRLQQFPNNTFRLTLAFTASVTRPAILRFRRTGTDAYRVEARDKSHSQYKTWLSRCTDRTRHGAKAYGIR